jgi:diguanylate cyclase (GGDEF)-like protein
MTARESILIVDDTPENLRVMSELLAPLGCQLLIANSGKRALEIVERITPTLILLDVMMPDIDGFETCRRLRKMPALRDVPVLFVTALTDEIQQGFACGGNDYITKPINATEVQVRVKHHLEKQHLLRDLKDLNSSLEEKVRLRTAELSTVNRQLRQEVQERRFMQDRLNYLARHDFVTQLYNRDALDQHMSQFLAKQQTEALSARFLSLNIVDFRLINDSCGCIAGDDLLHQFASRLMTVCMPERDFVARLSADRFAIFCTPASHEYVESLVRQIQHNIEQFQFEWEGISYPISISLIGLPVTTHFSTFEQIMLAADDLAWRCRQSNTKIHLMHDQGDLNDHEYRSHLNWGLKILEAIRHDSFEIYQQKITALQPDMPKTQKIEILLRMRDPEDGCLIFPNDFIRAAERLNLISRIDRWVVSHVFKMVAESPELFAGVSEIAINLSALTLRETDFADFVHTQLDAHALQGSRFCFEITETEALNNFETTRILMDRLHSFGCRIALDDFGSGFSSFAYLLELPFDYLKIDGLFVRDLDVSVVHASMVRSIVQLAHILKKPVVAEYVENREIAQALQDMGVEWGQGYYFHRPEPVIQPVMELE